MQYIIENQAEIIHHGRDRTKLITAFYLNPELFGIHKPIDTNIINSIISSLIR